MASRLEPVASRLEAMAKLEAIRLEAMAGRAMASRLETIGSRGKKQRTDLRNHKCRLRCSISLRGLRGRDMSTIDFLSTAGL